MCRQNKSQFDVSWAQGHTAEFVPDMFEAGPLFLTIEEHA